MTEQEKKELLDELEKRMDEKYKGCLTREDVATTLKVPREKWFRDENGNGRYSLMADAFDSTIISWQVWETIRKLTCVVCGKQYVRQLANVENAVETWNGLNTIRRKSNVRSVDIQYIQNLMSLTAMRLRIRRRTQNVNQKSE